MQSSRLAIVSVLVGAAVLTVYFAVDAGTAPDVEARPSTTSAAAVAGLASPAVVPPASREVIEPRGTNRDVAEGLQPKHTDAQETPGQNEVFDLVALLESYDADPEHFHARALPVVLEIRQRSEKAGEVVPQLVAYIEDPTRAVRVRGALFLALAPIVDPGTFERIFGAWTVDSGGPGELVRCAALASEARGEPSTCSRGIDLAKFSTLSLGVRMPLYPLMIQRVLDPSSTSRAVELLSSWDRGIEGITSGKGSEEDGEALLTREVLLLVLGPRALVDPGVEALVRTSASSQSLEDGPSIVTVRAAYFVLRSLAACREDWSALVEGWKDATHPVSAGLARLMASNFVGEDLAEMFESVERRRRSSSLDTQLELFEAVDELAKLLAADASDEDRREGARLMLAIASDSEEAEIPRFFALSGLETIQAWGELCDAAQVVFASSESEGMRDKTVMVLSIAMSSPHKERVREVLAEAERSEPDPLRRERIQKILGAR